MALLLCFKGVTSNNNNKKHCELFVAFKKDGLETTFLFPSCKISQNRYLNMSALASCTFPEVIYLRRSHVVMKQQSSGHAAKSAVKKCSFNQSWDCKQLCIIRYFLLSFQLIRPHETLSVFSFQNPHLLRRLTDTLSFDRRSIAAFYLGRAAGVGGRVSLSFPLSPALPSLAPEPGRRSISFPRQECLDD